ncbi:hypothetical protein [Gorillibacterium sp. sgz5001074]|uniref:hypothetical protein n=1 Tax=Gorillibacterium sp. sgz5001074 TaxID=3446695 RepID=UPI003F677024
MMDEQEILKKLRCKAERATALNAPEGYGLGLGSGTEGAYGFVLLYVRNSGELNEWLPKTLPILEDDAVFWICYPKKTSKKVETDLNRDVMWELVAGQSPYRPVSNVALDEAWSALRFRHEDKVKSSK